MSPGAERDEPARVDAGGATRLALSPDGSSLALAHEGGELSVRSLSDPDRATHLANDAVVMTALFSDAAGEWLGAAGEAGLVTLWSLTEGWSTRIATSLVGDIAFGRVSGDGRLAVIASYGGTVSLVDLDEVGEVWSADVGAELHDASIAPGALDAPGSVVVATNDGDLVSFGRGNDTDGESEGEVLYSMPSAASCVTHVDERRVLAADGAGRIALIDAVEGLIWEVETERGWTSAVEVLPEGMAMSAHWDGAICLGVLESGSWDDCVTAHDAPVFALYVDHARDRFYSASRDGDIRAWRLSDRQLLNTLSGHQASVTTLRGSPTGHLFSSSDDATVRLWEPESGRQIATLMSFHSGGWAVVGSGNRFDAHNAGRVDGLHFVAANDALGLDQLRRDFFRPGLLPELMRSAVGDGAEERTSVGLSPDMAVSVDASSGSLRVVVENRGGGIGPIAVRVNGREVIADARPDGLDPELARVELEVELPDNAPLLARGNRVAVVPSSGDGRLEGRGFDVDYVPVELPDEAPTRLFALVAGVSDYAGDALDLRFAAKDAADFAQSLSLGADPELFAETHIVVLGEQAAAAIESETVAYHGPTSRRTLLAELQQMQTANPGDVVIVFLAGHGRTEGGAGGDFYYLTREATDGDLDSESVRFGAAVSSRELTQALRAIPALRQVLIIDTCAAGRVVDLLGENRAAASNSAMAASRLADRNGVHVLAGSAADAVSYESSRVDQGLLTHALLMGLREGQALRRDGTIGILHLFDHAVTKVPEIAAGLGGVQAPRLFSLGHSFDVGRLDQDARTRIPLAGGRVLVGPPTITDQVGLDDHRIEEMALRALDATLAGADVQIERLERDGAPGAYRVRGEYREVPDGVEVTLNLFHERRRVHQIVVTLAEQSLESDVAAAIGAIVEALVSDAEGP